jgi:hypothetical protein
MTGLGGAFPAHFMTVRAHIACPSLRADAPWASTWRWLPWSKAVDHVDDAAEQVKRHRQLGHLEDGICFVVVAMSELEAML